MRSAVLEFSFLPITESGELVEDLRRVFAELASTLPPEQRVSSGEYHPSLDILETTDTVEIVVDLAGVPAASARVLFRGGVLIVAGQKAPSPGPADSDFHFLERGFGRFARAVQLTGAFEIGQARAVFRAGELTIVLPKRTDRRGRAQTIPITTSTPPA
jgi:HSP20 family protein